MYQVPSNKLNYFEQQINDVNRQIVYRFTLNDEPLESNLIFDNPVITYDGGLTQYGVGSVVIKHLELSVHSSVFVIPTSTIKIEVGLSIYNDTTQEWEILYSPFGVFHVDDVETTGAKKVVRAYDGLFKLAKGYFPSAKHTTTTAIANDIATSNSLNVKGMTSVNIDNEQLEGKTCLEMLSLLAGATGANVVLSRDGQTIEFVEPKETNLEFNEVDFVTPTTGEDEFNITKLVVHYSDKVTNEEGQVEDEGYYEVGEGTDRHTLELSNPLLKSNKQQATIILNKIKKMNGYKRFETTLPTADFRLDPFDIVTFHQGEDTFVIPLLFVRYTLTHRGIGLLVETTVDIPSESEFSFKGTLTQKVENIYTDIINVKDLIANKVTTDKLEATIAKIEQLYVKYGEFEELVADSAIINKLQADLIEVDNIIGNLGQFDNLEALVAEFQLLKAKVAEIDNLIANTILSEIIQTGSITSDMLNIRDGFIQDAMIDNLSASKIHSGVLNTNNVNIESEDGDMTLRDNLLQFKDSNGIVRIQIGKDSKGAYTFTLYDATGKGVLINQDGIQSSDAIKDGLIVNDNINDNANINAGKLDINSVFKHMNEDGSNTLKGTKIHLDATKQNLEVSFKNMTNKQTEQEETMNTLITDFNIEQGKITQLIQDTTISVDGENKKLKDVVNRTVSTVDSHTVTIGQMESTMDAQTGQLQSMNSSLTQVKQDMKGITSTVGSVQATVSQQGTALSETQKELGTSVAGVDVKYYHSTSNTQLIGGSWQNTAPSYVEGKYIWTKTITTLKDGTVRESSPTCLSGTNGKDGANGSDGKGVKNIEEYYAVSTSNTQAPTNWSTTVPTMTSTNKYLWNYEVITYTDNSTKSTAKRVIGVYGDKGQNGTNGVNGQDGKGIKSITNYYLATNSSSGVTTSTSGWTTTVQSPTRDKKYLWNYEKVTYTDNSTTNTTPCVIGNFAQDGMNGSNGTNGADAYTVILSNENHTFPCESNGNIPTAINATTNVIAYKGATSVTPTIGNLPTVNGLTLSKSGTTVTIQANTGTALASSGSLTIPVTVDGKNFNKVFSWSKAFKGANGASGSHAKSADIVSTSQVFKSTDGGVTFSPDNITLTPILQNVSFSKWQYSTNGGSSWSNVSSGQNGLTLSGNNLVINKGSALYTTSVTSVTFKLITNDSNIYDTTTVVKLYDVTDLEIGGANVLRNGNFARGLEYWSVHDPSGAGGSNKSVAVVDGDTYWRPMGKKTLEIRGTMTTNRYGVASSIMKLDPNTQYTVSGYCAGHRVGKIQINVRDMNASSANIFTKDLNPVTGGATLDKWYRFELTFTTTSNTDFALNLYSVNFDDNGYVWFCDVQIQKGNKATDWNPCPTDGTDYTDKLIDDLRKLDLKQITDQNQESSDMIANILNDSLIMPHEKTNLKFEFERIKILKENAINYYNTVNDTSFQQLRNAMNTAYTNVENMINPILTNMTQTSNASNSAVHTTFQTFYTAYETLMTALQQSVIILATKHSTKLEQLDKEITMTASKAEIMQDKVNQFDAHMRFSADGFVEIFATENGKKGRFSTQITNKKLSFKDNDVEVAYVSNQELNINKAVIKDRMSVGNFVIKPSGSSTGGIVFAYETI